MDNRLYSVDELTKILKLHPKTILRFIHEGKIKAQKIGRAWRVSQDALRDYTHGELAGADSLALEVETGKPSLSSRINVSAVVEINEQNSEQASRLSNSLMAALNCKDPEWGHPRVDSFYYPESQKAKYVLYGSTIFISEVMAMLHQLEQVDRRAE